VSANSTNYIFKDVGYKIGDTVTCVFQHRQVKGFVTGHSHLLPNSELDCYFVVMDVSKTEFVKSYVDEYERPKWEYTQIMKPMIYSFRLAPTKCVLFEKINKWPNS